MTRIHPGAFRARATSYAEGDLGRELTVIGPYATAGAVKGQVASMRKYNAELRADTVVWVIEEAIQWQIVDSIGPDEEKSA